MTTSQVPDSEPQMIDPLYCMGETKEDFFRALSFARAGLVQLRQRYEELQQQHAVLGDAFDARGAEIERLKIEVSTARARPLNLVPSAYVDGMHLFSEDDPPANGTSSSLEPVTA